MASLTELDKKYIWHPFTQYNEWKKDLFQSPVVMTRGRGVYLYDSKGKKYIDGVSSLWANIHGHQNPRLDRALESQMKKISHSTFLGLTHEPGIRLAQELIQLIPAGLSRVFYSDNGSTAVEAALKMAFQHHAQSSPKSSDKIEFLALKNSYHGDTIGAVSVGGIDLFHKKYKPLLFKTHFAMSPNCLRCPHNKSKGRSLKFRSYAYNGEKPKAGDFRKETGCRWECLGEVETILKNQGKRISAAIIEPIVQGAGGMVVMPPGYLWGFANCCRKYGVLLIADEVAVGFGRTGKLFACEHENIKPDLLCLAKGLSGGYLPLAATLATEKIFNSFKGKFEEFKTFFHGHTFTANPLACAVARENLKIFKENQTIKKTLKLEHLLKILLQELTSLPVVGQIRHAGLMGGIELVKSQKNLVPFPIAMRIGKKVCMEARKYGVILRPLGDVVVILPPLSIQEKELRQLIQAIKKSIIKVLLTK